MPMLHEYKDGRGYYIKAFSFGARSFVTYQLKPEGMAYLEHYGFEDGDDIGADLLAELRNLGYAYTYGGGVVTSDGVSTNSANAEWDLALEESGGDWQLGVLLPHIPEEWVSGQTLGTLVSRLASCYVQAVGGGRIPAVHLLPGRPRSICTVAPQLTSYILVRRGPWPQEWQYATWERLASGLNPGGTLFEGGARDGKRLRKGGQIALGEQYYLVGLQASGTGSLLAASLPIPNEISQRYLGRNGNWAAWELEIPDKVTPLLRTWAARLGYVLQEPGWRLILASPPPISYTDAGSPVLPVDETAVIAVCPPENLSMHDTTEVAVSCNGVQVGQSRLNDLATFFQMSTRSGKNQGEDVRYLAIPMNEEGTYEISAIAGRVTPLRFETTAEPQDDDIAGPQPLSITLRSGSRLWEVYAFEPSEQSIRRIEGPRGGGIEIAGTCAAPVTLVWEGPQGKSRHSDVELNSDEGAALLRQVVEETATGTHMWVEIDAGNFGRVMLDLALSWLLEQSVVPEHVMMRARWLLAWVQSLRGREGIRETLLPSMLRKELQELGIARGSDGVLTSGSIPAVALPYFYDLAGSLRKQP